MTNKIARKHQTNEMEEVNHYINLQQGFIKLNFDRATKGNPGEAGTGGLFRKYRGTMLRIYTMDCDNATNNEAELHALKKGLEISIREEYQKLQAEGDAKLVVDIVK